jgi:uncharacterized membrane protein
MMRKGPCLLALLLLVPGALQPCASAQEADEPSFSWRAEYRTYAGLVTELFALQAEHPDLVMLEDIGTTYEGRDIWAVKLSDDVALNDSSEPDVLIFGPVHAREVMGVEVPMSVLHYMIDGYGLNETLSNYINTKETWFVPMPNPDGHVYIEQGNDWRKNRRPTTGGNIGVDINRNWGYMFGVDGATSDNPASEVYHGPYPFSENETIALRDLALRQHFVTSLSYHSVASLVLYPWGYTNARAPHYEELDAMARAMAAFNGYTPQQSNVLYQTHGTSDDWLYGNMSTLAFTVELDTAFHPDPSHIPVSCALNRESTLYLIGYPNASIVDAGIFGLPAPFNNTIIEPDREMNISALVMNYGSGEADIPVEAEIASGPYRWSNSSTIRLRPGQTGLCNLSWFPPLSVGENCTIKVRTNLSGDNHAWNDEKAARFRIKPKYGAALDAESGTNRSCYPGESVSYPLLLRSLGNRDDEIRLELTGGRTGWAAIDASVRLPPAGTQDILLNVSVPRNAGPGDIARISVRAFSSTGQGAAGVVDTATRVLDPAPTANAGDDITINVTREIVFDGTRSTTPTGALENYSWDFGDGAAAEGPTVRHAYEKRGFYVVNLTVRNDLGYTRTDSLNVTVLQEFNLTLEAETLSLRPAPGETVSVNFTLTNAGNGPDRVALELVALRWNATIDAGNATLGARESLRFSLRLRAPADATAGTTAFFRVSARSLEYEYAGDEAVLTATVREVRDFRFVIADTTRRADAGQSLRFTGLFTNAGNVPETANLTADGAPEGWAVELSRPNVTIAPWSNQSVTITVGVPARTLAGDYSLRVNGIELDITVNARYRLDATVGNNTASSLPGRTVTFNLTVFNDANAPDNFTITVGNMPAGWPAPPILRPVMLAAGQNATVSITIAIPGNATSGLFEPAFTVRSAGDANQTRVLPVQVTVVKRPARATASEALPLPLLLLLVVVIAVIVMAVFAASRRKGPAAEALPPGPGPAGAAPMDPDGRRY